MCLPSKQQIFLLTCLLTLSGALPSLPILPTSTHNISDADNSLLNSTLAAVIPTYFKIIPSQPLDEPVLDPRITLALTIHVLGVLALDDFDQEQQSQTWRSTQHVAIEVIGPSLEVHSSLPMRKYAIWGIYKAVHLMVASDDFRCRNYELYWQGALVGWVEYNNGVNGALGMEGGTKNGTGQEGSVYVSANALPSAATTEVDNNRVTLSFKLHGRTIGESNVFMALFTGILKVAPYSKNERVQAFIVNARSFDSYLSFREREDTGPDGPYLRYERVIQILMQLPQWMISHGNQWTEADMLVLIDDRFVGVGVLRWQVGQEPGTADGGNVMTS